MVTPALLTEAASLPVERYELPNLLALNFVVPGLLAPGVSGTTRPDAQAKGLGEYLRSRIVEVPADIEYDFPGRLQRLGVTAAETPPN